VDQVVKALFWELEALSSTPVLKKKVNTFSV
jgi:hypothetical protein